MKLRYIFYCKHCGHIILKMERLAMFPGRIKCPKCKKYLTIPDELFVRMSDGKEVNIEMEKGADDKTIC